jgi:hypothetical protein
VAGAIVGRSVTGATRLPARVPRDVERWRHGVLRRAGFDDELARSLSRDGRVDLHDVLTLVDRGCPPCLAARILAPL